MYREKENHNWTIKINLSLILIIGLFIISAPRNLGAFYLPSGDAENSGRITSASPLGETQFKSPTLASEYQPVLEINDKLYRLNNAQVLIPLTPQEVVQYNQHRPKDNIKVINNTEKKEDIVVTPKRRPQPPVDEPQEKQLPAGIEKRIEKQGDQKQPDNSKHDIPSIRKKSEDNSTKINDVVLNVIEKVSDHKSSRRLKVNDNQDKNKPKLELEGQNIPIDKKEDSLGLPQIKELKLDNPGLSTGAHIRGPQIRIRAIPGEKR